MTNLRSETPIRSGVGSRWPSEKITFVDRTTGVVVTALTTSSANDQKIYQDHPQWMNDERHIIFRSNRADPAGNLQQAFAVDEVTGGIVQLTEGPGLISTTLNVARRSGLLYFLREEADGTTALVEWAAAEVLRDNENGTLRASSVYERVIFSLAADLRESGGFALDAEEHIAYLGCRSRANPEPLPQVPGQILAIDLKSGEARIVAEVPFLLGHVQTNPWVPGEIIFCHETGGKAPQRMWAVQTSGQPRSLYSEAPEEWVTHEAVVTRDEVMFALMGHLPRLRRKPTGIAVLNLRTEEVRLLGQCDGGQGFWHVNGSADGLWAVGDDFDGRIHLIDRRTGAMTLLTVGHVMKPDHAHPTFDPQGNRILFQSGMLSGGKNLNLMVVPVPSTNF